MGGMDLRWEDFAADLRGGMGHTPLQLLMGAQMYYFADRKNVRETLQTNGNFWCILYLYKKRKGGPSC